MTSETYHHSAATIVINKKYLISVTVHIEVCISLIQIKPLHVHKLRQLLIAISKELITNYNIKSRTRKFLEISLFRGSGIFLRIFFLENYDISLQLRVL